MLCISGCGSADSYKREVLDPQERRMTLHFTSFSVAVLMDLFDLSLSSCADGIRKILKTLVQFVNSAYLMS